MPVYDYNGQIFELDETDPAKARARIQQALGETPAPQPQEFGVQEATQMALPAAGAVVPGPSGMADLAKGTYEKIIKPTAETAVDIVKNYPKRPFEMMADVALTATGIGPVAGAVRGAGGAYDVAKQAYQGAKELVTDLSKLPAETAQRLAPAVQVVTDKLTGPEYQSFKQLADKVGIERAVHEFPFSQTLMKDPSFGTAIGEMRQVLPKAPPSLFSSIAGPLVRGGAKVLGPVGLGMDVYDAAKYAQESQLGSRLAQGQGQQAQQAFRQMNTQYGAPITPDQAQAVLQSGSARDIAAFGGQERLNEMIRRKAAERVLGPIAPGM